MECEAATPLIEALVDDELDVASAAALVAHLDSCGACAALRRDAETRRAALREARPLDRLPESVRARVAREVGRSAPPGRNLGRAAGAGLAAAGLVAVVVAAVVLRREQPRVPAIDGAPVLREVTGEVFCLRCALSRLFPDTPVVDERHLPVLRTEEGEVITLLDGRVTETALAQKGCAGRRVAVTLRLFPRQEIAEVLAVRTLGPAHAPPPREAVAAAAARLGSSRR